MTSLEILLFLCCSSILPLVRMGSLYLQLRIVYGVYTKKKQNTTEQQTYILLIVFLTDKFLLIIESSWA